MLFCDESGKLISVILKELLVLEHVADSSRYGGLGPGGKRILSVGNGLIEFTLGGEGDLSDHVLG